MGKTESQSSELYSKRARISGQRCNKLVIRKSLFTMRPLEVWSRLSRMAEILGDTQNSAGQDPDADVLTSKSNLVKKEFKSEDLHKPLTSEIINLFYNS